MVLAFPNRRGIERILSQNEGLRYKILLHFKPTLLKPWKFHGLMMWSIYDTSSRKEGYKGSATSSQSWSSRSPEKDLKRHSCEGWSEDIQIEDQRTWRNGSPWSLIDLLKGEHNSKRLNKPQSIRLWAPKISECQIGVTSDGLKSSKYRRCNKADDTLSHFKKHKNWKFSMNSWSKILRED